MCPLGALNFASGLRRSLLQSVAGSIPLRETEWGCAVSFWPCRAGPGVAATTLRDDLVFLCGRYRQARVEGAYDVD
jgi:hypothetical protein